MAILIAWRKDERDAFENVMCLLRIDALQLHEHGPLVVPSATVLKHGRIIDHSMSVAISDLELVLVIAERALLSCGTFKLSPNYNVCCCSVVILLMGCGAAGFLFLLYRLWSINGDFTEHSDLLFSFLPELWICLFLENLHVLVGYCEFECSGWHEATHRALPLKVHTCLRAALTEDVLAWEFRRPHHDHHTDRALRSDLEIYVLHCSHLCFLRRHAFNFFFLLCDALFVCPGLVVGKPSQPFTFFDCQEQVPLECFIIERSITTLLSLLFGAIGGNALLLFTYEKCSSFFSWHYHGRVITA